MSIDSAMDSLSTASDHSVASSNESMSNRHRSRSPADDRHSIERNGHNLSMNKRTPTPGSPTRHHHRPNNSSPLTGSSAHMMPMPHPLSPPTVSTPNNMSLGGMPPRIVQSLSHLPPHGLGLLNSLQMMHHASPLDLMAAAHHHGPPRSYNSPPPISSSDPTANECKLVDYRGQKVAAFMIQGETMLCLPQAFELFLKHLVGGLHTVYTKLKRLDIVPLVCNVEQVRILRGLGAIQPGVNRCKLLACKDFDVLYRDCTTARCLSIKPPERYKKFYLTKAIKAKYFTKKSSYNLSTFTSRPGRPPKRGPVGLSLPPSNYSHPSQLTKKHRLDNGDYGSYENGHLNDISRMDKSPLLANGYNAPPTHLNHIPAFMQMNHHPGNPAHALMSPGMPPHGIPRPDGSIIKGQNLPPAIEAMARTGMWENCRAAYEDIVKHLERLRDERGDDRVDRDQKCRDRDSHSRNGSSNGHSPVLNLSKSNVDQHSAGEHSDRSEVHTPDMLGHGDRDDDNISEVNDASEVDDRHEDKDEDISDAEHETATPPPPSNAERMAELESRHSALNYSQLANNAQNASDPNCSSTETLLRNIQGLLKVAADNARQQERQISYEKAELKMDVLREREVKDSLERQLTEERKLRGLYQKRCKREKRNTCRLREQLEHEIKKRNQIEEALKASGASAEILRIIAENSNNEHRERNTPVTGTDRETRSSSSSSKQPSREPETGSNKSEHNNNEPKSNESSSSRSRPSSRGNQSSQANNNSGTNSTAASDNKQGGNNWNYPGLQDVMASGAFWQNYSESLAQDLERKARQRENSEETADSPVKSSLSDRSSYYKNSVLYSSAT